tara:strand:+ start:685 stop:1107 length:423 start_codon:yes stop_codon:yes gene_type:complete
LKSKKKVDIFFLKILVSIISLIAIIYVSTLYHFFSFDQLLKKCKQKSNKLLCSYKPKTNPRLILNLSRRINNFLKINSCLRICLSQKIIFAILGFRVEMVCGVKKGENNLLDGHAWITFNGLPLLSSGEEIGDFVKSFVV